MQGASARFANAARPGNHDGTNKRYYKPLNIDGKGHCSFQRADAEYFALDGNYSESDSR